MLIPDYWAEARVQSKRDGKTVTVRRFGWSILDQTEAQHNADQRAEEGLARILAGERLARRELKRAYNGSESVPIREEVIERRGDTVITRNSYGARCLNTPDCLFADIDFHEGPSWRWILISAVLLLLVAAPLGFALHLSLGLIAAACALIFTYPVAAKLHQWATTWSGGPEKLARRRVERFVDQNPMWRLHLYRTPAGLRLLAVHTVFDPADPIVAEFFRAIGADPIYVRMCLRQRCFRARVSPKPWRVGLAQHMRPQSVWPFALEKLPARRRWIDEYEQKAKAYASCKFIESLGSGRVDSRVEQVQRWHDELCQAHHSLPLA